jgi:flagellar hook-associated protein 2
MAAIPVGGLATGLDTNSLVDRLLAVERRPIALLEARKVKLRALSTAFTALNAKLLDLKAQADTLASPETFPSRSVISSAETVATAVAAPGAIRGTYTVTVTALARGSIAAATTTKAALTDTVASAAGSFEFKLGANGAVVSVPLTATTTLEGLVRAINDRGAGVKASAVNTGTDAAPAYKLTLTSTATGSANNIVIVTDGTTLGVANTQTAADAAFSVTGLGSFTRPTNTFADVIDGVTATLKATGSADLAVEFDKSAIQSQVRALLAAYNAVIQAIDSQSAGPPDSEGRPTAGAFTGDAIARQIRDALSLKLATRVDGPYRTLAEVGVTTQKDGTVTLDSAKFERAFDAAPAAVVTLFAGTATRDGIADALAAAAAKFTKSLTGTIAVRQDGLSTQIAALQKQIAAAQARLDATEQMLRARFAALEKTIARLQRTGDAVLSELARLDAEPRLAPRR